MGQVHSFIRRRIGGILLAGALAWAGAAIATDVKFVGSVGYSQLSVLVSMQADRIQNFAASTSGALRMELWATPAPFAGSFSGGYQLAAYGLGPLAAGASLTSVNSGALPWSNPPSGTWHVTMVLTEQAGAATNGGYVARHCDRRFPHDHGKRLTAARRHHASHRWDRLADRRQRSGTVTVAANAADNVGVTRVDFYVNGSLKGSDTAAPYQYSWNTAALPNGAATLYAKAFDAAGNSTQSATVAVTVANVVVPPPDTTPPTASIASPTGGNVSGTVTVTANAADNVGVTRVDFYVNGSLKGSDTAAPYQYSWNTAALPNGAATLYAKAFDAAGNSTQSATVAVTVANVVAPPPDTTPPTASMPRRRVATSPVR